MREGERNGKVKSVIQTPRCIRVSSFPSLVDNASGATRTCRPVPSFHALSPPGHGSYGWSRFPAVGKLVTLLMGPLGTDPKPFKSDDDDDDDDDEASKASTDSEVVAK